MTFRNSVTLAVAVAVVASAYDDVGSAHVQLTQFVMAKCPMSSSLHLEFARKVSTLDLLRRTL